jgi:hypothetical protein
MTSFISQKPPDNPGFTEHQAITSNGLRQDALKKRQRAGGAIKYPVGDHPGVFREGALQRVVAIVGRTKKPALASRLSNNLSLVFNQSTRR